MAAGQHLLAFFQAGKDLVVGAEVAADLHHPDRDGVVRAQHEHGALAGTLLLEHGGVRDHDALAGAEVHGHAGVHARAKLPVRVGYAHLRAEGMRGGVHRGIQAHDGAGVGLARQGVGGQADLVAALDAGVFRLGNGHQELHGRDLLDRVDGLSHREQVAAVVVAGGHHAAHRGAQDGVLHQVGVRALGHVVGQFQRLVVGLCHAALIQQLLHAVELGLVVAQAQFGLLHLQAVHLGEHLPGGHEITHLDVEFHDAPAGLRGNVIDHVGLDGRGIDGILGHFLPRGGGYGHDRRAVFHSHRVHRPLAGGRRSVLPPAAGGKRQRAQGESHYRYLIHCRTFYSVGPCRRRR